MNRLQRLGASAGLACAALLTTTAQAQDSLSLDNESSSLAFVTTKLEHVAEVLIFTQLSGDIQPNGSATLTIDADSIDAIFEIRDDRMKEFLFKTIDFPEITVSTQVDMATVRSITAGDSATMDIQATMNLLGVDHQVPAEVLVTNTGEGILVSSAKPLLLSVPVLGLQEGVAKLAELAGGISIGNAVSVSFTLRFE